MTLTTNHQYQDRAIAAYLGLAVGDALGATLEFLTPQEIQLKHGVHQDVVGGGWLNLPVGQVTDDTTMSLALGESILRRKKIDPFDIAESYSQWLRNKPVDVGHTVRRGIIHFRYGGIPITPENEWDAGNGACMRTLPVALSTLFLSEAEIRMYSRDQAHTTHNNALSDAATECIILMIQSAMSGDDKLTIKKKLVLPLIEKFPLFSFEGGRRENPSGFIVETIQAVFQSFFNTENFSDSLIDVVNRGGDSDTTGAILGMLAGSYYGKSAIPEKWLGRLDPTIKKICEKQAMDLFGLAIDTSDKTKKLANIAANG